jgi:hypothetical protein
MSRRQPAVTREVGQSLHSRPRPGTPVPKGPQYVKRPGLTVNQGATRGRRDVPFGNYLICEKALANGILSFCYAKSRKSIVGLPQRVIPLALRRVIESLIDKGTADLSALSDEDIVFLKGCIERSSAQVDDSLFDQVIPEDPDEEKLSELETRLDELTGEISAGNDAQGLPSDLIEARNELTQVLNQMVKSSIITATKAAKIRQTYCHSI